MSVEAPPPIEQTPSRPIDPLAFWKRIRGCVVAAIAGILVTAYGGYNFFLGPQPQAARTDDNGIKPEPQNINHVPTGTVIFDMQDATLEPTALRLTHEKRSITLRFLQGPRGKGLLLSFNELGYTVVNADFVGNRHSSHVSTVKIWDDEMVLESRTRWYAHMRAHIHQSEFVRVHKELQAGHMDVTINCTLHGFGPKPQIIFVPLTFERE